MKYSEQIIPWQANSSSAEILGIFWDSKVHSSVRNSLPIVPILSQMDSVHVVQYYCCNIHWNITLQCTPTSSKLSLNFSSIYNNM
jgi:hypothetical protein